MIKFSPLLFSQWDLQLGKTLKTDSPCYFWLNNLTLEFGQHELKAYIQIKLIKIKCSFSQICLCSFQPSSDVQVDSVTVRTRLALCTRKKALFSANE